MNKNDKQRKDVLIVLRKIAERPGYLALIQENNAAKKGAGNPVPYFNTHRESVDGKESRMRFQYAYLSSRSARHLIRTCSKSGVLIQFKNVGNPEVVLSGTVLAEKGDNGYCISTKPMWVKAAEKRLTTQEYLSHLKITAEAQKKFRQSGQTIEPERCWKTLRPAAPDEISRFASGRPLNPKFEDLQCYKS